MRGRKPKPTALKRLDGNPGKRGYNHAEPVLPAGQPDCPAHLSEPARAEWHRIAGTLHEASVLTLVDRAALAAYCQAWGRWVEAEEKLAETPVLLKTPSGYVQQNPWLSIANKQLEIMGRYMAELGITPASRSRVVAGPAAQPTITFTTIYEEDPREKLAKHLDAIASRIAPEAAG
jgi:P27 family predicted phage terminase small subunit